MKLTISKVTLVQVLQKVQSITDKKSNMPILGNVLIDASEAGDVEFCATDLELSMRTQVEASVEISGSTTAPARKLLEVVREIPVETIRLETLPNEKLRVHAGRSRFELSTIPAEDFPVVHAHEEVKLELCDGAKLAKAFDKIFFAVPAEEDSYSIAGVFVHRADSGHVRFVSIDGHRLAYYEFPFAEFPAVELGPGIIVPRKGVQEILRLLEKDQENCFLGIDERFLVLKTASAFLSVQLLEGGFPAYGAIIPEERPYVFTAEREAFHSALRRMAVVTSQKWRHAQLHLTANQLEMTTENPDTGSGSDVLDVEYSNEDFVIAFNVKYLLDAVEAMEGRKVVVEWVDDVHGGIFHSPDDPGLLALVMPMVV